ncbi:MAG: hypothetical protein NTX03_08415 [Bacteroidetes bacterium]|nr:hypothetical protein [Bacteroidota bacterium]
MIHADVDLVAFNHEYIIAIGGIALAVIFFLVNKFLKDPDSKK